MKKTFSTELAYLLGIVILAIGTAFMERTSFGMSMIVAPAYLLHLKLSQYISFFTFGMGEYVLQALLILVLVIIQRKISRVHIFSFVTAVLYGFVLDGAIWLIAWIPFRAFAFQIAYYAFGMMLCATGVALLFRTYIPPEAYELFVKEIAAKFHIKISKVKTLYDCTSCVVSILLSFTFFGFGHFEGIHVGTIVCALLNGWLIGRATRLLEHFFEFRDRLPLRKFFEVSKTCAIKIKCVFGILLCALLTFSTMGCSLSVKAPTQTPSPSAATKISTPESTLPTQTPQPEPADEALVRIQDYIPNIFVELPYATTNNFTGQVIYDFTEPYLRYGTVKKLAQVQEALAAQDLYLKIWDGFRPTEAQWKLWNVFPDPTYVSDPNNGYTSHCRGNTVDITLCFADGTEVIMPTGFDNFSALADRDYSDCSQEAAANALLLEQLMVENGFKTYYAEWWHYTDTQTYPVYMPST